MFKAGLKLFSTNTECAEQAEALYEKSIFSYIELYSVPDSYAKTINVWKSLKIPFVIHAAHYGAGMNLAIKDNYEKNQVLAKEAFSFADELNADKVIFHTGVNGTKEETARQINLLADPRIIIENKPYLGNGENLFCVGSNPQEIEFIMNETQRGFCLDFGHAVCAANSFKKDVNEFISSFHSLKPLMYHISDGFYDSEYDTHERFGEGNFPLNLFVSMLEDDSMITNECKRINYSSLEGFEEEINLLQNRFGRTVTQANNRTAK
ncbi:MAG TPA: TIM barrel protein [Spirochaetota bacterium]|nr:TIM barrel protein [Spirochaetota bacterium]HOH37628.1 TIM barrel protein [Spirochaetota bacterium]